MRVVAPDVAKVSTCSLHSGAGPCDAMPAKEMLREERLSAEMAAIIRRISARDGLFEYFRTLGTRLAVEYSHITDLWDPMTGYLR